MLFKKDTSFLSLKKIFIIIFLPCFFLLFFLQTFCFALVSVEDTKGSLLPVTIDGYSFWMQGSFVIRFMREGENAVPPLDSNGNGCPDFVENVALQFIAAQHIFCDIAGFPEPIGSKIYPDAQKVYVTIGNNKKLGGSNGLAFDLVTYLPDVSATSSSIPRPRIGGLAIRINRGINPFINRTPMHEYFHLIQNSMSHIKNRWYYEGMATWAQFLLYPSKRSPSIKFSPHEAINLIMNSQAYKQQLISESYGAAKLFWNPFSAVCPEASIALPEDDFLLRTSYLDGSPIIEKKELTGVTLMQRMLVLLGTYEKIPFSLYNYNSWNQENRRRETNNKYIIDSIIQSYKDICPSTH